jgi:cytochrome o ubiquinol oxidase subunit IV
MSMDERAFPEGGDVAPGDERNDSHEVAQGLLGYLVGLALATLITGVAFFIASTSLVWGPSIPIALVVLAIAQIGVHLIFFLHITTGPDNINNVLALAFGVLVVFLLIVGSLWIMSNMNHNMMPMPMDQMMDMQH